MAQALALLQNSIEPDRDARRVLLHHNIKPENILVMDNGTTSPSLKLDDFGVAGAYRKSDASKPAYRETWMQAAGESNPHKRPTVYRLINDISVVAKGMLRNIGGKAALVDLDVDFSTEA
ncbi:hypothetical protein BDU57DRAFT_534261 [Ampelomyces quisqualis]|uniref:Protein kinase domain-containing protein n=1 Tax=Ampelomyces quisqualis TaxID=50730 RepID=A0A6A5QZ02_AMPQU|nr:hypothetical protein BDU57DRAFT_534261 [Ampelomyces quisqualis]